MIYVYVITLLILLGLIYALLKQREKFIPLDRIRNLAPLVPNSQARFTLYSNMCPEYNRTLTKFPVQLRDNCLRKL